MASTNTLQNAPAAASDTAISAMPPRPPAAHLPLQRHSYAVKRNGANHGARMLKRSVGTSTPVKPPTHGSMRQSRWEKVRYASPHRDTKAEDVQPAAYISVLPDMPSQQPIVGDTSTALKEKDEEAAGPGSMLEHKPVEPWHCYMQ